MSSKRPPNWALLFQEYFHKVERVLYILVAVGIAIATAEVIYDGSRALGSAFSQGDISHGILKVMDRFLLALMFLEILHTVQIVFSESYHLACVEPFLMVAIIASIRRFLLISFETSHSGTIDPERFRYFMIEMVVLGLLVIALVGAVLLLRKSRKASS